MSSEKTNIGLALSTVFLRQLIRSFNTSDRNYSESFKHFDESTITITKNLGPQIIKKRNTPEEKIHYCSEWINQISAVYGMNPPSFEVKFDATDKEKEMAGLYAVKSNKIILFSKISLVTLMHEFRHAMQNQGFKTIDPDIEEDARAWSMSLFKIALPKVHANAVKKGLVKFK